MTDDRSLREARRRAEAAVSDMPDGELKVKAFEIILQQLIISIAPTALYSVKTSVARAASPRLDRQPQSLTERILSLQAEGFFKEPQSIGSVRQGLKVHGWIYPVTTLSGALQALVQKRKLRRERMRDGNKTGWKYFNP